MFKTDRFSNQTANEIRKIFLKNISKPEKYLKLGTFYKYLKRNKLTYQRGCKTFKETNCKKVKLQRKAFVLDFLSIYPRIKRIITMDEAYFNGEGNYLYGWAKAGQSFSIIEKKRMKPGYSLMVAI